MGKLVVVSNRLPTLPKKGTTSSRLQEVGGLVSALLSALEMSGGGVWFGWNGKSSQSGNEPSLSWEVGSVQIIGIGLADSDIDAYYNGFSNRALWPLMHSFHERARLSRHQYRAYQRVNTLFAEKLMPHLDADETIWVNDYHLFLLGRELRNLGHKGPIGFFLHIPFPSYYTWQILPEPEGFLKAMLDYDLVAFHTQTYRDNYVYSSQRLLGAAWEKNHNVLNAFGKRQRVSIVPIGIDPKSFQSASQKAASARRRRGLADQAEGRRIILGVDRLDYTKGIPERFLAFEALLKSYSAYRRDVVMFQICAPSRTRVPEYMEQKRAVDAIVGRINGELAEFDWVPIRYLYRSYPQDRLSLFYRDANVCLVTPMRDGMNLVAKEFIASQDPEDPGVLVLSRFTGAAEELVESVLVNPYLPEDVATGIHRALAMPREERVARHEALLQKVGHHTSDWWFKTFLGELAVAVNDKSPPAKNTRKVKKPLPAASVLPGLEVK